MKIGKSEDFKQNEVYHDKNLNQNKDLSLLRYNIYSHSLVGDLMNVEPTPNIQIRSEELGGVWEDALIFH